MAKVKIIPADKNGTVQWQIMCPGCSRTHLLTSVGHTFDGNLDRPSFSPGLVQNTGPMGKCHSIIADGYIRYFSDCTHALAGNVVALPEII